MFKFRISLILLALLSGTGCATIVSARLAQRELSEKGVPRSASFAEQPLDLTGYSLQQLVDFAMTNRPSMVSAALAVADARLALRQIEAEAPLVSATPWNAAHASASGGYAAASAQGAHLSTRTKGNASAGLSLDILIYDFGRHAAAAGEQAERVLASELAFGTTGYAVFEEVTAAYFDLKAKDALLEVAMTNETECALRLKQAEDRFAAGEAKRLDITSAKLDLSQAHEATIVASNDVVTAGATMMKALGIDATRGTREQVFPATGGALASVQHGFARTHYSMEEAFALAQTNSLELAYARAQLRAASRSVDAAIADLKPSVSAEVGISWADPLWAWHWGVSAVQSIFEGFRKTTAVDRAVVRMESAAAEVDEAEQLLSLRLETAIAVRDNAAKALETARDSVANALENLNTVKAQYQEGDADRVDFTMALSKYAEALGKRVQAFYTGQTAESRLFSLLGRIPEYDEKELKEK